MAVTFTKLTNGNVILNDNGEKYNLGTNSDLKAPSADPDLVVILDPEQGKFNIDWNDVTSPAVTSRDDLFDQLNDDFFFKIAVKSGVSFNSSSIDLFKIKDVYFDQYNQKGNEIISAPSNEFGNGCHFMVPYASLGDGSTLSFHSSYSLFSYNDFDQNTQGLYHIVCFKLGNQWYYNVTLTEATIIVDDITSPNDISDLRIAYDAYDIDADETDNSAYSDGADIGTLTDFSDNNNDATKVTGATPLLDKAGSEIAFTSGDYYELGTGIDTNITAFSAIFGINPNPKTGIQVLMFNASNKGIYINWNTNTLNYSSQVDGVVAIASSFSLSGKSLIEIYIDNGTTSVYVNGTSIGNGASVTDDETLTNLLGRSSDNFLGDYQFTAVYDKLLNSIERTQLRNFCNNRHSFY